MLMMACAVGAMLGMWEGDEFVLPRGYDHHDDPSSINLTTKNLNLPQPLPLRTHLA